MTIVTSDTTEILNWFRRACMVRLQNGRVVQIVPICVEDDVNVGR